MPVDPTATGFTPRTTSLFRPVPPSNLKSNMGDFFDRTKEFVGEQLDGVSSLNANEKNRRLTQDEEESGPRLQPQGMGKHVDMLI